MRRVIMAVLLLLSPLALAQGASGPSAKEAQQVLQKVEKAFNAHDAKGVSDVFAKDATLIDPTGQRMHGRQDIQTQMTDQMKSQFEGAQSTFTLDGTRPVGTSAIWTDVTHQVKNMKKPDGTRGTMTFHLVALLQKEGGQWLVTEARPYAFLPQGQQGVGGSGKK